MKTYRIQDYKDAKGFIDLYMKNKRDFAIIHYACQGFYSNSNETSPRIVAICILFPNDMRKQLFSLASLAEIQNVDLHTAEDTVLNRLEKEMLQDFYAFVKKQKKEYTWLHWNMRDQFFGFSAIAQRYCVLFQKKKAPFDFTEQKQKNIALLLKQRYGDNYVECPHQQKLFSLNKIELSNLLTGKMEAEAYERREFLAMERSLEAKVEAFASILNKIGNNELKTKSRLLKDIYGFSFLGIITYVRENIVLGLIFSVIGTFVTEIILKWIFG